MKFTVILALASVFTSVISAPVAAPEKDVLVEKRQSDPTSIIISLNAAIAGPVASIESTLATISPNSSASGKSAAQSAVTSDIAQIVSAVGTATSQAEALVAGSGKLARRQADGLQSALTTLLTDVNNISETLVSDLGLSNTLSILNPLVSSLSNLLLSLEPVVNNLLALVQTIVDDLLNGLSAGLSGLVL